MQEARSILFHWASKSFQIKAYKFSPVKYFSHKLTMKTESNTTVTKQHKDIAINILKTTSEKCKLAFSTSSEPNRSSTNLKQGILADVMRCGIIWYH